MAKCERRKMVAGKQVDLHLERWHFAVHCLGIWISIIIQDILRRNLVFGELKQYTNKKLALGCTYEC